MSRIRIRGMKGDEASKKNGHPVLDCFQDGILRCRSALTADYYGCHRPTSAVLPTQQSFPSRRSIFAGCRYASTRSGKFSSRLPLGYAHHNSFIIALGLENPAHTHTYTRLGSQISNQLLASRPIKDIDFVVGRSIIRLLLLHHILTHKHEMLSGIPPPLPFCSTQQKNESQAF